MDEQYLKNKLAGALYGQALGDAFGMPTELWGPKRTHAFFKGPVTELIDGPAENNIAFNYKKGQFTDDTGQALVLLDSLAATSYKPDARDIAGRLLAWSEREHAFENNILGPTSKAALAAFRDGKDASAVTDAALSNGSAMRIGPVGSMFGPDEKARLTDYVYGVTRATHTSDVTIAGAAMIAEGVASAVVHDDFEDVLEDILDIEPYGYDKGAETCSPRLAERVKIGIEIARGFRESGKTCSGKSSDEDRTALKTADTVSDAIKGKDSEGTANIPASGSLCKAPGLSKNDELFLKKVYDIVGAGVPIIESVPAAVTIAYYAQDPNRSALLCANLCGDTDTIGAMATSICGAYRGADAIKPDYRALLEKQNPVDFNAYTDILMKGRDYLSGQKKENG